MSQQNSEPTIYDGLMFVSLGVVFLVLSLNGYGWSNGG